MHAALAPTRASVPDIDFRYFEEGSPGGDEDLDAVVAGVEFARAMAHRLGR